VKNLTFKNVALNDSDNENVGTAVGLLVNNGTVDSVTVSNGSVSSNEGAGGIVGRMTIQGTISNCTNYASVNATAKNAGEIVGAAYYTDTNADGTAKEMFIDGCHNYGTVTGAVAVGGIVGLSCANVTSCTNEKEIATSGYSIGGIVGEQRNYGEVKNCTNVASITNNVNENNKYGTGGIVGWVRYEDNATEYKANEIIQIEGNTNSGSVLSTGNNAGGIIGTVYNAAVVTGNTNKANEIKGVTFAAGIVGNLQCTVTPITPIPNAEISIKNNTTETTLANINATNKTLVVWNNPGNVTGIVIENNTTPETDKTTD